MSGTIDWQRLKGIFNEALERDESERAEFILSASAGDTGLRANVEALLAAHASAGSFIQDAAVPSTLFLQGLPAADANAEMIGPYRLVKVLGEGGMGRVYLAQRADDAFRKQVALKVIKRGMDTDAIVRRFRGERQAMATLDHPNIAKLLDGGTTRDGLPYFAMDYVEGLPIDQYCDRRRLTIEERLRLFRTVCSAVQHAHRNLIVHRDLKPANVLVSADGVPKLLDFGIAKLLNPGTLLQTAAVTAPDERCMTLHYASPEQVRGEPVTTATDVYSLGVILYELLTGHRPYQLEGRTAAEAERTICEHDPERPSSMVLRTEIVTERGGPMTVSPESVSRTREGHPNKLRRCLVGDLDNIVLMAMRKEPQRRYASVEQFSEDIGRHLAGLPIIARTNTTTYRGWKFVRRHPTGVVTTAVIALLLVGGTISTAYQARVAEAERARAERRFNDVRTLANALIFELHDEIEKVPGSTAVRQLLVKRALEYLTSLSREAADSDSLQRELATAYQRVADVQGNVYGANSGDFAGAITSYGHAAEILERLIRQSPGDHGTQQLLAATYERLGSVQLYSGKVADALSYQERALALRVALAAAGTLTSEDVAKSHYRLGEVLVIAAEWDKALESFRRALTLREQNLAIQSSQQNQLRVAATQIQVAWLLMTTGNGAAALADYRKALALTEPAAGSEPVNVTARRMLAIIHQGIAEILADQGSLQASVDHHFKSLRVREALATADAKNATAQRDLALGRLTLAPPLARVGRKAEALPHIRESLAVLETLALGKPTRDVAIGYHLAAKAWLESGEFEQGLEMANKAIVLGEAVAVSDRKDSYILHTLGESYVRIGDAHQRRAETGMTPRSERLRSWEAARTSQIRAREILSDLQARGGLTGREPKQLAELPQKIARIEEQIRKLQKRP